MRYLRRHCRVGCTITVTERTREIGIRKALGALKRDILVQFLLEPVLLGLLGDVMGIAMGSCLSTLASNALELEFIIETGPVLLDTGFAGGVGLVFGIHPAWRAAGLQPIEARDTSRLEGSDGLRPDWRGAQDRSLPKVGSCSLIFADGGWEGRDDGPGRGVDEMIESDIWRGGCR